MAGTFTDRVEKVYAEKTEGLWRKTRIVLALFVVYVLVLFSPFVKFYPTNIHGLERLATEDVLSLATLSADASIFELPFEDIKTTLELHPLVEEARWVYGLEGLSLEITERRIVARYCTSTCSEPSDYLYLAKGPDEGYVTLSLQNEIPTVPLVTTTVWNDALASALWTLTPSQVALITDILPTEDTPLFENDVRLKLSHITPYIYVSTGELPVLMQPSIYQQLITSVDSLTEQPASLLCGINENNVLVCVKSSFTN